VIQNNCKNCFLTEKLPYSQICGTKVGASYKNGVIAQITSRIDDLAEPLASRRERIQTAKTFHQLRRDIQDEILWCDERLPLAQSDDYGNSLHTVQKNVKRNEVSFEAFFLVVITVVKLAVSNLNN